MKQHHSIFPPAASLACALILMLAACTSDALDELPPAGTDPDARPLTITVSDGHGGTASVDITINIVGTNDRPTLTLTPTSDTVVSDPGYDKDHNEVAEDLTVTGTFEGADPDSNPTLEYGVSTSAGNRDTAFDANGNNPGMGGGHHSATGMHFEKDVF